MDLTFNLDILIGFYFGFLFSILLVIFVLFLQTRESIFFSYLLFLLTYVLVVIHEYGLGFRYSESGAVLEKSNSVHAFLGLNCMASILFGIHFLRLHAIVPKVSYILYAIIGFNPLWIGYFLITGNEIYYEFILASNLLPYLLILLSSYVFIRYHIYLVFFFTGWFFHILFYSFSFLVYYGILNSNKYLFYGFQFGSGLEVLLLSIATIHKLYEYKTKTDALSQEIIKQKEESNLELQELVELRTNTLEKAISSIQKDVEVARGIQLSTIPRKVNWTKHGLDVGSFYLPKERVSGDIYDLCMMDEDRFRIFIADATGHGIQAGFFTMSIKTEYERIKYEFSDPAQVLRLLNQSVFKTFKDHLMLYSCFVIDIDLSQNFIQYASAGHPEQFLIQNGSVTEMKSTGAIMGFMQDYNINSRSIPIRKPFQMFLYTDGITEARNSKGEEYGTGRILKLLASHPKTKSDRVLFDLFNLSNLYAKDVGFEDDITMIYIRSLL